MFQKFLFDIKSTFYHDKIWDRMVIHDAICNITNLEDKSQILNKKISRYEGGQVKLEDIHDQSHIFKSGANEIRITFILDKEEKNLKACYYAVSNYREKSDIIKQISFEIKDDNIYIAPFEGMLYIPDDEYVGLEVLYYSKYENPFMNLQFHDVPKNEDQAYAGVFVNLDENFNCYAIELHQNNNIVKNSPKKSPRNTSKNNFKFEFTLSNMKNDNLYLTVNNRLYYIDEPAIKYDKENAHIKLFKIPKVLLPYAFVQLLNGSDIEKISDKYLYNRIYNQITDKIIVE